MAKDINRRNFLKASSGFGLVAVGSYLDVRPAAADAQESLVIVEPRPGLRGAMMPVHFGQPDWPQPWPDPRGESHYHDVTGIAVSYLTDREQLSQYLPRPFELEGPPVVTVAYSMNRDITWLAGGHYNIVAVTVRARYPGNVDDVSGAYALAMWENLTDPILTGRELQGIPKTYGDIEDHRVFDGVWTTTLSVRGKTFLDLAASELTAMEPGPLQQLNAESSKRTLLGWKYIPNETGSGPVVSYATEFPISARHASAWSAKGHLKWYPQTWRENPMQAHIANAFHALPVKEIVGCLVSKSSTTLHTGKVRRLR